MLGVFNDERKDVINNFKDDEEEEEDVFENEIAIVDMRCGWI